MTADLAVAFHSDGKEYLVIPTPDDVLTRHRPDGTKDWLKTRIPSATQHGIDIGPVTVPVTEKDIAAFEDGGWSTTLGQKLVRALRASESHSPEVFTHVEICGHVDTQGAALLSWRDRQERASEASQKSKKAPKKAETGTDAPKAERGYVHRDVVPGVSDFDMLDYAREHAENVLLSGPSGSGKSTLPVEYARERGLDSYCVAGNVALEPSQLFGKFVPEADGGFAWSEGPVTRLVRNGGVLVLDEINILSPKIATVLYPLLDFRREITLLDNDGEVIKAHKDLLVVATCNPGYQGTLPMSEALLDRFAHRHDWGYDAHAEEELVSSESLLEMARGIRAEGDVRSPFSTRLLVAFEKFALSPLGWDYAVANLLGRFSDSEDRESVRALLDVRSDKIQTELGLKPLPDLVEAAKAPGRPSSSEEWRKLLSMWA